MVPETEKLTYKQQRFVDAYLGEANGNAVHAARIAGYSGRSYSSLGVIAHVTLKNAKVAAAIHARLAEHAMAADDVLYRLSEQARSELTDFIVVDENGHPSIDFVAARKAGKLRLVQSLEYDRNGRPRVKFYSARDALETIGRYYGLWKDKQEQTGANGGPIVVKVVSAAASMEDL